MKAKLAILLGCICLLFSISSFACGGSGCGDYSGCDDYGGCGYSRCDFCNPTDCQCTDPGWQYNDCMSKGVYCEAFGNVGGR